MTVRILVVEDNPVNQEVAAAMLEALGCEVHAASNGIDALELLEHSDYELVFMDREMPLMDGLATTVAIREREAAAPDGGRRRLPVVALTPSVTAEDRQAYLDVGMDDCLSKPFTKEQLAQMVEKWAGLVLSTPPQGTKARGQGDAGSSKRPTLDPRILQSLDGPEGPGNGELGPRLAATFLDSTQRLCRELSDAAKANDETALARAAHSLKSSAAQVGAFRLSSLAKELETAVRAEACETTRDVASQIQAEFEEVKEALAAAAAKSRV